MSSRSNLDIQKKNQCYTDGFYGIMEHDEIRNLAYQKVIRDKVKDKVVVEVGTGRAIFLTKMCVDYGAMMVYTIEENRKAFQSSREHIQKHRLQDKIKIHNGFSCDVQLDEKGDVFLHEIVGVIGSDEGMVLIANDAKSRFLKSDALFIPYRCRTFICPVSSIKISLKDQIINYLINATVNAIGIDCCTEFQKDNSYLIYNFPSDHLIGKPEIFEDIIFHIPLTDKSEKTIEWDISEPVHFNGFALFIELFVDENNVLNSLEQKLNWPVVYVKLLSKDINLKKRDRLTTKIYIDISCQQPIYTISTCIMRNNSIIFQKDNLMIS